MCYRLTLTGAVGLLLLFVASIASESSLGRHRVEVASIQQQSPPDPALLSKNVAPQQVAPEESFVIELRAINRGEGAIYGSIAISFPKLTGNGAGEAVEVVSSSNENGVDIYESGAEIASRGGQTVNATYLLVEQGGTEPWPSGQEKRIRLRVTPPSAPEFEGGTFPVNYRVTQEKQTWPPEGTASAEDQQGWPVQRTVVRVEGSAMEQTSSGGDGQQGGKGEGAVSGTVVDIDGQPVPGAQVRFLHVPSKEFADKNVLLSRKASESGQFVVADLQSHDGGYLFLTARSEKGRNVWFGTKLIEWTSLSSTESLEIVLKNEVFFGPVSIRTPSPHLEIVTVWRRIAPKTPYQQSLYVEVTNANAQNGTGESWDLTTPYVYPLFEGFFSPFVSERVRVSRARTGVWELPGNQMKTAERWHPSREEIQLPLFASLRPRGATEVLGRQKTLKPGAFQPFTKADLGERQDWDTYFGGVVGLTIGEIPSFWDWLGAALTIGETYKKLTGPVGDRLSAGAGLIDLSKSLGEAQETIGNKGGKIGDQIDLNKADQLGSLWKGEAQSVVYEMPISFRNREADSRPLWIYATWHETDAQLLHGLEIGPTPDGPGSNRSAEKPSIKSIDCGSGPAWPREPVEFSVSAQNADRYNWSFGDGTSASGKTVSHAFDSPGTYDVEVTARSAAGEASRSTDIYVRGSNISPKSGLGNSRDCGF